MSDIYIRVRLCSNRHQEPQIQASSRVAELQVDKQGLAVFEGFELPAVTGYYDLLVDALIKAGPNNFRRSGFALAAAAAC
jgi:hypothetical protein